MALIDKKVSEALLQTGVVSAPDKLTGTAAENKAVFDRLIRAVVAACLNPVLDELAGEGGAAAVGGAVEGMAARTVQGILAALKALCDQRYTKTEAEALVREETGRLVKEVTVDAAGVWTFTKKDGTKIIYDTKLEKIVVNFRLEGDFLVLGHDDGTEERVSIAAFRDHHGFADSGTVAWSYTGAENNRTFTARIKPGSVTLELLALDAVTKIENDVSACAQNAAAALEAQKGAQAAKQEAANSAAGTASNVTAARAAQEAAQAAKNQAETSSSTAKSQADRATSEADRANREANRAKTEADSKVAAATAQADRATAQADRAKTEADRAADIAGGDYATQTEMTTGDANTLTAAKAYTDGQIANVGSVDIKTGSEEITEEIVTGGGA